MHFRGYVFGDAAESLMNSLIHRDGHPPGDLWLPLDVTSEHARSGWIAVEPEDWQREIPRPYTVDRSVHCVWPTAFLREQLGPLAMLGDGALSSIGVCRRNVRRMDGNWYAAVPRFFDTIGDHWSIPLADEHSALVTLDGGMAWTTTVGDFDLQASVDLSAPWLVVGPDGPVFYDVSFEPEDPAARRARIIAAAAPLLALPSDTPVILVDWHG